MPSKYCDFIKELCPQEAQGLRLLRAPEQCDNIPAVLPGFHKGLISGNLADGLRLHKSSATWQSSMVLRKKHKNKCVSPLSDTAQTATAQGCLSEDFLMHSFGFFPLTTKCSLKILCSPCIRKNQHLHTNVFLLNAGIPFACRGKIQVCCQVLHLFPRS